MSRAADAQSKKKEQKAAVAAARDKKAELLAMGLNSTMKKLIGDDQLLCTACGATSRGGVASRCECKGGVTRPGPDFDAIPFLIAAAKVRHEAEKAVQQAANVRQQAEKQQERGKRREGKAELDLDAEFEEVDGVEVRQLFQLPVGKLGMDIERNVVVKVNDENSNAKDLGIKVGWVITEVNGKQVRGDKKAIIAAITTVFKGGEPCPIRFRCPLIDGNDGNGTTGSSTCWYCFRCEKFLEQAMFDVGVMGSKNHGQRSCSSCEDCADMFDDEEEY